MCNKNASVQIDANCDNIYLGSHPHNVLNL